jgi:hypothetical protein
MVLLPQFLLLVLRVVPLLPGMVLLPHLHLLQLLLLALRMVRPRNPRRRRMPTCWLP